MSNSISTVFHTSTGGRVRVVIAPHNTLKGSEPTRCFPDRVFIEEGAFTGVSSPNRLSEHDSLPVAPAAPPFRSESPHREVGGGLALPRSPFQLLKDGARFTALAIFVNKTRYLSERSAPVKIKDRYSVKNVYYSEEQVTDT